MLRIILFYGEKMKLKRIISLIIVLAVLCSLSSLCFAAGEIVDPYRLYSYEQMCADIKSLEAAYPELISVSSIGTSVEGRDIPVFTLGKGDRMILICASMHAREYVSTNFVMYMAEQYCRGYTEKEWYAGLSYQKLLDNVCFVIVPMLNPDGVTLAQNGLENAPLRESLEQMELVDAYKDGVYAWKANINGVDLNRNWPYNWAEDEKVNVPASANYNGTAPCTEPEVIAMKKLIDSTPFYMLCSFHTSGEVIYWIDSSNSQQLANKLAPTVSRIASFIGYRMLGYENISKFGGYMVNYARATYERPCFTVELCPIFARYPYDDYAGFANTVKRVLPIGLIMADEAMKMDPIEGTVSPDPSPEPSPEPLPAPEPDKPEIQVQVHIDGAALTFEDVGPIIENSRTLVPVRAVCEALGLTVGWEKGQVTISDGETLVSMNIGSTEMFINDESVTLEAAPKIVENRTLLPIRAVLEAFGHSLDWDSRQKTVLVTSKTANYNVVNEE